MQLSGQGGGWRVVFPTTAIIWVGDCFGGGLSFLVLLSLAFVVVLALDFCRVAFTFTSPAAALVAPSQTVLVVLLVLKACPPRLGVSGDREEYC